MAVAADLGETDNGAAGDSKRLYWLVVSAIPVGAMLSDVFSSRRRHTSSTRDWSSDVCSSDLLTITPANDANFTLGIAATAKDAEGNLSTTTSGTELVTVNSTAPKIGRASCRERV